MNVPILISILSFVVLLIVTPFKVLSQTFLSVDDKFVLQNLKVGRVLPRFAVSIKITEENTIKISGLESLSNYFTTNKLKKSNKKLKKKNKESKKTAFKKEEESKNSAFKKEEESKKTEFNLDMIDFEHIKIEKIVIRGVFGYGDDAFKTALICTTANMTISCLLAMLPLQIENTDINIIPDYKSLNLDVDIKIVANINIAIIILLIFKILFKRSKSL